MSEHVDTKERLRELPEQCRRWHDGSDDFKFRGGRRAFDNAENAPGFWHPVYEITLGELGLILRGHRIRPKSSVQTLMFCWEADVFCAYPATKLPQGIRVSATVGLKELIMMLCYMVSDRWHHIIEWFRGLGDLRLTRAGR